MEHGRDDVWEELPDRELGEHWRRADARDYSLFARLAGVRNYNLPEVPPDPASAWNRLWGQAPPIFEPLFPGRGLPPGEEAAAEYENGDEENGQVLVPWLGDHSHTWATFEELARANWDVDCRTAGYVRLDAYRAWQAQGRAGCPDNWCSDVGGTDVVKLTEQELARMDAGEGPLEELARSATGVIGSGVVGTYVLVTWVWRPLPSCDFVGWVMSADFAQLCARYGGDNLRLLIGFDS